MGKTLNPCGQERAGDGEKKRGIGKWGGRAASRAISRVETFGKKPRH